MCNEVFGKKKGDGMDGFLSLFTKIPATVYVAFASAILTAAVTLLASYLTNKATQRRMELQFTHERDMRNREIRGQRLEEVYILANESAKGLVATLSPFVFLLQGRTTYQEAQAAVQKFMDEKDKANPRRLEMLLDLYFNQLREQYDHLLCARNEANALVYGPEHRVTPAQNADMGKASLLLQRINRVHEAGEQLQKAIADQAAGFIG